MPSVLSSETVFRTPWFSVVAKTLDAGPSPYYLCKLPDYASVLALTDDDRVILVRQYRPVIEAVALELPGGLVDPGESPAAAIARELLEETGYTIGSLEALEPAPVTDIGRLANRQWGFVARGCRLDRTPGREPEAGIQTVQIGRAHV